MTISRFKKPDAKWILCAAHALTVVGVLGFVGCWTIGWTTESRVFGDKIYKTRTLTRSDPVRVKSSIYYLEPIYAKMFTMSERLIIPSFTLLLIGGAYVEYRKRRTQYPWS